MSKGIIVVDMPERCKDCDFIREDFHGAYCERESDEEGLCKKIPIEIIRHRKPYWCPINPIPERARHEDYCDNGRYDKGCNDCLNEVLGIDK